MDEFWENHAVVLYDYNNLSFEVVYVQCTCLCVGQVFSTGKLISFTKNNLEVCVKQVGTTTMSGCEMTFKVLLCRTWPATSTSMHIHFLYITIS